MAIHNTIHFAGSIHFESIHIAAGGAACCDGEKANLIRSEGRHTYTASKVTCKRCIKVMEKYGTLQKK